MKSHILNFFTILLILTFLPITSFADAKTVNVNHSQAERGDEIVISGIAEDLDDIIIKIVSPNNTVFYLDILSVGNGEFSTTVGLPTTEDQAPFGEYKIIVGNNASNLQATFSIVSDKKDPDGDGDKDKESPDGDGDKDKEGSDGNGDKDKEDSDGDGDKDKEDPVGDGGKDKEDPDGNGGKDKEDPDGNGGKDKEGGDGKKSGDILPKTATTMYTILLIGLVLLMIGAAAFFVLKINSVRE